jgi:hypothetical protein
MSGAHAVLEQQCAACHVRNASGYSSNASDGACLACHDGPIHHENEVAAEVPTCATCHVEHRGRIRLNATSNQSCVECHGDLKVKGPVRVYAAHIGTLEDGHPEFAALRQGAKDPGTIRLNHQIHMKPIRRGPTGPIVQLECADCHRPAGPDLPWPYEDRVYVLTETSYSQEAKSGMPHDVLPGPKPLTGQAIMIPVQFATACAGCHLLTFDKRFEDGVPHDKPKVVHAFLVKRFQDYIFTHPGELRAVRDPKRDLTGKPKPPDAQVLTPEQWVEGRVVEAQELLWRKTCKQCHAVDPKPEPLTFPIAISAAVKYGWEDSLPKIAESRVTERWLPHAKFDHDAHRGFSCVSCHAKALTSTETSDILVPGIANCKTCHAPGPEHAESRCFECHTYHDWAKRKEVKATYTMPALERGGK